MQARKFEKERLAKRKPVWPKEGKEVSKKKAKK
jgi:hypothetical protein